LLALVGIGCLTFNWLAFFLIMTCSLIAYALRISVEGKALRENLEPEYVRYSERTIAVNSGKIPKRAVTPSHPHRLPRSG
jgi:protein-S-isoprenylcysteine O-methyltransferase Ste14